jgi:DNA segregation ATPase FtsK/SpoIIIE-like protein
MRSVHSAAGELEAKKVVVFEISAPPPKPPELPGAARYRLLPLLLGVILILAAAMWWIGAGVPGAIVVVVLGGLASAGLPRWEAINYDRRLRQREQRYRDYLDVQRGRLAALTTAQQTAWAEHDPEPAGCVRLARNSPERLWQADSSDLLEVRVGTTSRPSNLQVAAPIAALSGATDPLIDAASDLARGAQLMPGAAVRVALQERNAVCGPREPVLAAARALLMQLCTHYSPDRLKLFLLCAQDEVDAWRWARWLPHLLASDGRTRNIAWDRPTAQRRLADAEPHPTLVVLADPTLSSAVPAGFSQLLLSDPPPHFSVILDVVAPSLTVQGQQQPIEYIDTATVDLAERLARALAARRPRRSAAVDDQAIVEVQLDGSVASKFQE